jgi:hypothetical protein
MHSNTIDAIAKHTHFTRIALAVHTWPIATNAEYARAIIVSTRTTIYTVLAPVVPVTKHTARTKGGYSAIDTGTFTAAKYTGSVITRAFAKDTDSIVHAISAKYPITYAIVSPVYM